MRLGVAALTCALMLACAARAAALGQVSYDGCVSVTGSGGDCAATGNAALDGALDVALSPDGGSLYAIGLDGNGVSVFRRASGGQIEYDGCVSNNGSGGACADLPATLVAPEDVAVSPDGASVYVANVDGVTVLDRAPGGQISFAACASDDGTGGDCANVPGTPVGHASSVAVSPDGHSVYVASSTHATVTVFGRTPGGRLVYAGCVSNDGSGGLCGAVPSNLLFGANAIAVSPDGRSVYVSALSSDAVIEFDRAEGGQITYDGCASSSGSGGICHKGGENFRAPNSLVVSPDGRVVFATTSGKPGVWSLEREASGRLTFWDCVLDVSGTPCQNPPGTPVTGAAGLAISPDGQTLYVGAAGSSTIGVFDVRVGVLTYAGCVSDDGSGGLCADAPGTAPLSGIGSLALSPDGTSLYGAAHSADSVVHLFRKTAPDTGIVGGPAEGSASRNARPTFAFASDQDGAAYECALDAGEYASCPAMATFGPLADGTHTLRVRALTGGDPDPTPAARTFAVDTTGPAARLERAPRRTIRTAKRTVAVTVAFRAAEPGVTFRCAIDRRAARACSSPATFRVGRGQHRITVVASDRLGNAGRPVSARFGVLAKKGRGRP
ncbi:MAG TPA: hypothetical protein VJT75_08285 [Thermoleophilaceae bacterium]|nr:hypothetical protein [Thermoleophilaceae bacterium]